jgi:DNA-binding CsgD family transcriptional regulator
LPSLYRGLGGTAHHNRVGVIAPDSAWRLLRALAPALRIGSGWQGPIAAAIGEPALCRVVTSGSRIDTRIAGRLATPSAQGVSPEFRCLIVGPGPAPAVGDHPAIRWRATDVPLPQMCIISDALLIYERPSGPALGCLAAPTISLLANTFDAVWDRSGPAAGPPEDLNEVLAQLATGATDRKAQRGANLSARTFSRKVAELMRILGATSRFQAGAEAARRGWV